MFCSECGRLLADGEICSCQQQPQQSQELPPQQPPQPQQSQQSQRSQQPPQPQQHQQPSQKQHQATAVLPATPAIGILKHKLASNLYLVIAILVSVLVLLNVISICLPESAMGFGDALWSAANSSIDFQLGEIGIIDACSIAMGVVALISVGLLCTGLWTLFVNAKNQNKNVVDWRGITFVKIYGMIQLVIDCILLVAMLGAAIALIVVSSYMSMYGSAWQIVLGDFSILPANVHVTLGGASAPLSNADAVIPLLVTAIVAIVAVLVLVIVYYVKFFKTMNALKKTAITGQPIDKISRSLFVLLYAIGGAMAVYSIFQLVSLDILNFVVSICMAGISAISAYMLTDYRKQIRILCYGNPAQLKKQKQSKQMYQFAEQPYYSVQPPMYQMPQQQNGYQPQPNMYQPQQNAYQPQPNMYQPQPDAYQPQQNMYQSQPNAYQPQQNAYPSQQYVYQPQQNAYPSQQYAYQPQQGPYQPQPNAYQPQQTQDPIPAQAPVQPQMVEYTFCEQCGQRYPLEADVCPICGTPNGRKGE